MASVEGHPIPQDVTGFQFRLIGDMTVKQFAYLACGAALAWFSFILPSFFILKVLLGGTFALIGIILAFIPIDGRPADTMMLLFLKTLFKPTQYAYKKTDPAMTTVGQTPSQPQPVPQQQPEQQTVVITGIPEAHHPTPPPVDEPTVHEESHHEPIVEPVVEESLVVPSEPVVQETMPEEVTQLQQEETQVSNTVAQTQEALEEAKTHESTDAVAHQRVVTLEEQLQEIMQQKQQLEDRLIALEQQKTTAPAQPVFTPSVASAPVQTDTVKTVPQPLQKSAGVPLTPDVPNLISGVVKDARGNVLSQILVEVKDRDGNPVRAFKTNTLGQFASATPLLLGTYTVSFEDPKKQHGFDTVEIEANGQILDPLEVISVDAREELRKELFGGVG